MNTLGFARLRIVGSARRRIRHEGRAEKLNETKEAPFEAAIVAASSRCGKDTASKLLRRGRVEHRRPEL